MQVIVDAALLAVITALWARRHTWRMQWERAATLCVALQSAYTLLLSNPINETVSRWLHWLTGLWNCEELLGCFAYLGGLTALAYMSVSRLDWRPGQLQRFLRKRIELPATLFIPLTASTFIKSRLSERYVPDTTQLPVLEWGTLFWALVVAAVLWLLAHAAWALIIVIRDDRRSVPVAYAYLGAICVSLWCCAIWFIPSVPGLVRWVSIRAELAAYALAASYSWQRKLNYMQFRLWRKIAKGKAKPPTKTTVRQDC